jgi:hypothetical protein
LAKVFKNNKSPSRVFLFELIEEGSFRREAGGSVRRAERIVIAKEMQHSDICFFLELIYNQIR